MAEQPLSGWKEIASYLHQGVRTAQRWEVLGLPVHRMGAGTRAPVTAFGEELDAWERAAPMHLLDEIKDLRKQVAILQAEVRSLNTHKKYFGSRNPPTLNLVSSRARN